MTTAKHASVTQKGNTKNICFLIIHKFEQIHTVSVTLFKMQVVSNIQVHTKSKMTKKNMNIMNKSAEQNKNVKR